MLLKKGRILILKRKYFLVGLFLMLVMFLVGCNGNGGSTPPITPNQSPKEKQRDGSLFYKNNYK